jgi:hypothetical protein
MPFVYGYIEDSQTHERRYGWMALDALTSQ